MKRGIPRDALKFTAAALGLGAACIACCAAPAIAPLVAGIFAGSALAGALVHGAGWIAGVCAVGVAVLLLLRQRRKASRAAIQNRCDCSEEMRGGAKEPPSATALSRSETLSPSQQ